MPNSPVAAPRNEESAERLARPLIQLAKANGISTSYIDQLGAYVEIRDEVLVSVLRALGVDASSDEAVTKSYEATVRRPRLRWCRRPLLNSSVRLPPFRFVRQAGTLHCACCWKTVPPTQAIWRCAY